MESGHMRRFERGVVIVFVSVLACAMNVWGASEEAQRYYDRAQTALEMGIPEEAIKELKKATVADPGWADAHYELGMQLEKKEDYAGAIAAFRAYLKVSGNPSRAAEVKTRINKLEYKAEQLLSVPEIIDLLTSGFYYSPEWEYTPVHKTGSRECRRMWGELAFSREGLDGVKAFQAMLYYPNRTYYQSLKVSGPVLKYETLINVCDEAANIQDRGCDSIIENQVEILSRTFIRVTQKVLRGGSGAGTASGDKYVCTFRKK